MRTAITRLSIALAGSVLLASSVHAENWSQWRGPKSDGSTTEQNLPASLDPQKDLRWSTALPGPGSGTPVVFGDHVFVGALDKTTHKLLALCLNAADGKIAWQKEVAIDATKNNRNNLASPSPIVDDKHVYFYFGTGDLVCFDHAGNQQWSYNVPKAHGTLHMLWLESSTPLLLNGKLYIPVMHRDTSSRGGGDASMAGSYLLCLDASSGSELWRVVRPTDALEESREAYTTPIAIPVAGKTQIVLMGGDHVTGHDADTGKELWRTPTYNPTKITSWRTVASATFGDGLIFGSAPKDGNLFAAIPNDGSSPEAKLAWTSKEVRTDVCAPLFYKDQLFVLNGDGKKTLYCLDPKTGDKKWAVELGGRPVFRASPTGADDKIYCMNEGGDVFVVSAADGKVLSKTSLNSEGPARSSIVAANGAMYVRTSDHLYAFGKK